MFKETLDKYREVIDKELESFLEQHFKENNSEDINNYYSYIKKYCEGGKRLRPAALIMAYKAFNGKEDITKEALSVELLHTSTLIHDDIMDEDDLRRNLPTIHRLVKEHFIRKHGEQAYQGSLFSRLSSRFSTTIAIILGNMLYSIGNLALKDKKCIEIFNKAYFNINKGQILDTLLEQNKPTEEQYLEMIRLKTALLFTAAVEIGAVMAKANEEEITHLKRYAEKAAIAFQLQDDIMDISKEANKGHEFASDIKQGKQTLLVIKAMEKNKETEQLMKNQDIEKVIQIMHNTGAISYVKNLAEKYINDAKSELKMVNMTEESKDFFNGFADFMLERNV